MTSNLNKKQQLIVNEIIKSIVLLGGKHDIIGTIASWGDTIDDDMVLSCLELWNEATKKELEERLSMYSGNYAG